MKLTLRGYYLFAIVWLAPIALFDFIGNTIYGGPEGSVGARLSEFYYWKMMVDGVIIMFMTMLAANSQTASVSSASARLRDSEDTVVSFEQVSGFQWFMCLLIMCYAGFNFFTLHAVNKASTGPISMATAIWSFVSVGVALLSAIQFYHLKSGAIVRLKHQIVE